MPTKVFDGGLTKTADVAIGIDQSLTGFAFTVLDVDDASRYMTWVYKSPYFGVERLIDIRKFLLDHFDYCREQDWVITDIAMEGTVLATYAAIVLGELSALVRLTIYDRFTGDLRFPLKIPPMTLKKFAAGTGKAKKAEMLLKVYKRWGVEFTEDNACDSYALARIAGKVFIDSTEKAILDKIQADESSYRDAAHL